MIVWHAHPRLAGLLKNLSSRSRQLCKGQVASSLLRLRRRRSSQRQLCLCIATDQCDVVARRGFLRRSNLPLTQLPLLFRGLLQHARAPWATIFRPSGADEFVLRAPTYNNCNDLDTRLDALTFFSTSGMPSPCSNSRSHFFRHNPPPYPCRFPFESITRWQGITIET